METIATKLIPEMSALKACMLDYERRFQEVGYDIIIRPVGTLTVAGYRGLLLTATSSSGGREHSLSLDSGVDALHHVDIRIDGQRHPEVTETLFPMPPDLCATMKPIIEWFINYITHSHYG